MASSKPNSCCSCCSGFIITIGLMALFIWLSLRVDEPKLYIDKIYLPALNKALNTTAKSNTTFTFLLKLVNPNKDKGIQYDPIHLNFTFYNTLNTTLPLGNVTVNGFYQGHEKKAKKNGVVEAGVKNLTASVKGVVDGKVYLRVDYITAVKYKILVWYTKRDRLWGGANVEIGDSGEKMGKKSVRLGGKEPRVIVSGAWKVYGGYRALLVFIIGLGFT
ncbi:hypothetical protein MtrunA17_Chr2g0319481 [Medicago truncatula]|uniref:NDR1-like protein n=1 Tax=Medicago truncatula TaxID=3880 RepID=G7IJL6_MEDTR|nr:protein NDR1 [Medicago truncatula]AES66886.1 NDR1-like protein [Medicago truncatula]AFK34930.1 unknown [Medicago truncatula]AFK47010.1 unknown [Medicago truncatula]RHN75284.1 hypothetical protein MtrunA17_Chr2g0319481 [Medicago truncatula]